VKIRGNAHHVAEKYLQLARDNQSSGDPVQAENYFQHAEHYLRLIAAAQEQFRAQNPYYQAPPAPGTITGDEAFDGEEDGSQPGQGQQGQPTQGQAPQSQPMQGQPQQNQPNFGNPQNYNNQQPSYPPREQPQPYGGQPSNYQGRPQHQPQQHNPQQSQPYNPPQPYQPPAPQPTQGNDAGQLPSFITGSQPQQGTPSGAPNNNYDNQGGDFPRHRRRRHRGPAGPGGPRPEIAGGSQNFRDDGPDAPAE
jgi:hypothetical protein